MTTGDFRAIRGTAFESVRLRLLAAGLLGQEAGARAIVLTALDRGAGVTTIAVGLAGAIAATPGTRVLLVDASASGNTASAMLGMMNGRVECGALPPQAAQGDGFVVHVPGHGFDLLALEGTPPSAAKAEEGGGWAEPWARLRGSYDAIVVDPGPLTTDAPYLWERWTDTTVLVIDAERVTRDRLEAVRRQIDQGGFRVSGFVLNKRRYYVPDRLYRALS